MKQMIRNIKIITSMEKYANTSGGTIPIISIERKINLRRIK